MSFLAILFPRSFPIFLVLLVAIICPSEVRAAQLTATWADNSSNETGFKIERKTGAAGTFAQIASVGANTTSYTDSSLASGITYCYRVRAFNTAGNSAYTNEACATTQAQNFVLTVTKAGNGRGTVTSPAPGIACGHQCSWSYSSSTSVSLTATAATDSVFSGWSGGGCSGTGVCSLTLTGNTSVTATFAKKSFTHKTLTLTGNTSAAATSTQQKPTRIGLFRPSTGEFFLDLNGNGLWDGCQVDRCLGPFGQRGDLPVVGDWNGSGITRIGTFNGATNLFRLDLNGNGLWDGCNVDLCFGPFNQEGDVAIGGDWDNTGITRVGIFNSADGLWYLDLSGNALWDGCQVDRCLGPFGQRGDLPVVGDRDGSGATRIGTFNAATNQFRLDLNGNGLWDGCNVDLCIDSFAQHGDRPVVGDWKGSGATTIGIFRPREARRINGKTVTTQGLWYLDLSGNALWDGCQVDRCLGPFGQEGDRPVTGKWCVLPLRD